MDVTFLPSRYADFRHLCDTEWSALSDGDKAYLLTMYRRGVRVENDCNSAVAYCMGLTDGKPEGRCEYMSGELPDI